MCRLAAGNTNALGRQIAEVISSDLRASGVFETSGPNGLRAITLPHNSKVKSA